VRHPQDAVREIVREWFSDSSAGSGSGIYNGSVHGEEAKGEQSPRKGNARRWIRQNCFRHVENPGEIGMIGQKYTSWDEKVKWMTEHRELWADKDLSDYQVQARLCKALKSAGVYSKKTINMDIFSRLRLLIKEAQTKDPDYQEATIKEFLKDIPKKPQAQEDLTNQLNKLYATANRLGLYDAADYLRNVMNRK